MKKNFLVLGVFLVFPFLLFAQMEFLRHDGYYSFQDKAGGKTINFFIEETGNSFWVDGPEKIHANPNWFHNQNVNKSSVVIKKNKIQVNIKQPNNIELIGKGKIWYGEIKLKLKYYRGKEKINTQWLNLIFVPFEE
ncbi:MAG: hypothetical protein JXR53_04380 [Bacteroidales bacterium]|nr:hypothetical protein [Bacteroidales bacterium]